MLHHLSWPKASAALLLVALPGILLTEATWFSPKRKARAQEATARESATAFASISEVPQLFDPSTGEALVLYAGDPEGAIELFNRGVEFHPRTGERLRPLTAEVVARIRRADESRLREQEHQRAAEAQVRAEQTRQRLEAEASTQAERSAEERHRREKAFRDRYVTPGAVERLRGHSPVVLLAVHNDESLERHISAALRSGGLTVDTQVLRDSVFSSDLFPHLAAGDRKLLSRLGLSELAGFLLLARNERTEFAATSLEGVGNIRGSLTVTIVPLSEGLATTLAPFSEVGAGFQEVQAREALDKRLVQALLEQPDLRQLLGLGA